MKQSKGTNITGEPSSFPELQFPQLPHASPEPILITDTKARIYYVNPAWEKLTGYTLAEVKGKNPRLLNSGKTPKRVYKRLWNALSKGKSFSTDEICDKRKDGSEYQVYSTFFPIKKGQKTIFYVQLVYDITKQYQAEKIFQEHEERLRVMLNNLSEHAVFMLDKKGNILSGNEAAERITGYTADEFVGKNISLFYTKDEIKNKKPQQDLQKTIEQGHINGQAWRIKKDGTRYWADIVISAIKDKKGKLKGFVTIRRDISSRKELEEQKNTFIGIASHELKTPVTSLKMYAQVLHRKLVNSGDKDILSLLQHINNQTDRLTELINDLLNVNKMASGTFMLNKQLFDLDALVEKVVENLNHINSTHKIVKEGTLMKPIFADENRIEQVVINLLTNAIKYSPEADKVVVQVGFDKNKKHALLSVQDFGYGSDKKDQEKIFERFYRTEDKDKRKVVGFGLGLFITKEIVTRHNGKIWVKSEKGKGSTFYVSLPIGKG